MHIVNNIDNETSKKIEAGDVVIYDKIIFLIAEDDERQNNLGLVELYNEYGTGRVAMITGEDISYRDLIFIDKKGQLIKARDVRLVLGDLK